MNDASEPVPALLYALAVADADLRDRYHPRSHSPWYVSPNLLTDHLYLNCPGLQRARRTGQEPRPGLGVIYPEAGDVCGWCLRVWRSRAPT